MKGNLRRVLVLCIFLVSAALSPELHAIPLPPPNGPDTVYLDESICEGDSLWFNGTWRSQTGLYLALGQNFYGFDSLTYLTLTVRDESVVTLVDTICPGESYLFAGVNLVASGTYSAFDQSVYGCDSIAVLELTALNLPDSVWIEVIGDACDDDALTLVAQGSIRYQWNVGSRNDTLRIEQDGLYIVTGSSPCGTFQTSIRIDDPCLPSLGEAPPRIFFPSAFSPDGDGTNEEWLPQGNSITKYKLQIYNRWGEVVFETENLEKGWDGKLETEPLAPGAYFYVANYTIVNKGTFQERGMFSLIR